MILAVVLGVIFSYNRKRGVDLEGDAPITREFLTANTLFYGFLFVGILLFWNWFNFQNPDFAAVGMDAQRQLEFSPATSKLSFPGS